MLLPALTLCIESMTWLLSQLSTCPLYTLGTHMMHQCNPASARCPAPRQQNSALVSVQPTMPHDGLTDGFRDTYGSGTWSPACMARRSSHWVAAEAHLSPTMCHICLPCSCCCHCRLPLTHHPCHSSSSQGAPAVPANQQNSLSRQASVSSNSVHSAAAVSSGMVTMQRSRRNRVSVSSARQWCTRAVLAAGPVECIKSKATARCALSGLFG